MRKKAARVCEGFNEGEKLFSDSDIGGGDDSRASKGEKATARFIVGPGRSAR